MRVPLTWLHEYCAPELDAQALAERLAMTGTEVERVEHHGVAALDHFIVGEVLDRRQHPDADRLSVCIVDIGNGEPQQIVCGAPNVAAGQTVAVALPGAVMPDGSRLKVAKLRGIASNGMILAEDELAIGSEHDGIMVLDDSIPPGRPLASVLPIATAVLVLEVTPNRPDCLGIYGVAREVHAATGAPLAPPPWEDDIGTPGPLDGIEIAVESADLCPRFTARIFDEVKLGPSPPWMKARLMAAGQRPISNVVDITNYVMLLTGQPLHSYDLDHVGGSRLIVRRAKRDETLRTLDDQVRTLDERMVVIDDANGPDSIAGVMGGARSEVRDTTARVLLEAANWVGPNIHQTSQTLALRTEASSRFEKQLQPEQALDSQVVATRLLVELCGARVRPGTVDVGGPGPAPKTLALRTARVASLLGVEVSAGRSSEILGALGFSTGSARDGLEVTVPTFRRADIELEVDLIEEVARLDALTRLPATLPRRRGALGGLTARQRLHRRAADALADLGLHEVVGWSFESPRTAKRLGLGDRPTVALANPMSEEQAHLRTTLIGSLLDAARRNRAHGASELRLFETGAVYLPVAGVPGELPDEPRHVAAILIGPVRPATWRNEPPAADFFAIKGLVTALMEAVGHRWVLRGELQPFLHPGRAAAVIVDDAAIGWFGEIHPRIAGEWGIDDTVAAFELDLDRISEPPTKLYVDVTSFPEVREDLAVVVADTVTAAEVIGVVRAAGEELLADARVFDVYRDEQRLGVGTVSLALALAYRAPDRTLTDAEVAQRRAAIIAALERELEGRIRDS
jgi:phenylalanyl-tRNA synthetase beta chain